MGEVGLEGDEVKSERTEELFLIRARGHPAKIYPSLKIAFSKMQIMQRYRKGL